MSYRDDYRPIQGPKGDQGIQGPPGPQGIRGDIGPQGPTGPQGVRGPQGEIGEMGPRGPIGPQGPAGNNGARGPQGPEGPMGPRGFTGADGRVSFEKLTPEQLKMITGPEGVQGPEGPQGARGPQGVEGEKGEPGETGPQGPTGATGPAGPKGEPGPIGPQGLRGLTGPKGDPGDVNVNELIKDNAAWSSKQIVDYALHGKVLWMQKNIDWGRVKQEDHDHKIEGTMNGYARNLIVDGNTQTNESTLGKNYQKQVIKDNYTNVSNIRIKIFDKADRPGHTFLQGNHIYTLIYRMDALQVLDQSNIPDNIYNFNAKIFITKNGGDMQVKEQIAEGIENGYVKFKIEEPSGIDKIELQPLFGAGNPEEQEESYMGHKISFIAKDFMLLEGDFYDFIPPRYFYGEKGVGENIGDGKYQLTIESSNKNLIKRSNMTTDYYLHKDNSEDPNVRFKRANTPGTLATFFVYVKPNTKYTFSKKIWMTKTEKARVVIAGYRHEPHNGETALETYVHLVNRDEQKDTDVKVFQTGANVNLLVVYVANMQPSKTWKLAEVYRELQLEEGAVATPYEPNITTTRTIEMPQQLKSRYKLHWDNSKGQYIIETDTGERVETGVTKEELVHTYEGVTYVYVKSKIPATLHADFPVKAHNDYYTKPEIDHKFTTEGEDVNRKIDAAKEALRNEIVFTDREGQENLNGLAIYDGFRMYWREVEIPPNTNEFQFNLPGVTNVISAQVTRFIKFNGDDSTIASVVTLKRENNGTMFKLIDKAVNENEDAQLKQKKRCYYVLTISDARTQ